MFDAKSEHHDRLGDGRAVVIKPDLLFTASGSPRFVADIKYKLTDDAAGGHHADYYQLLAYTTALDLPEGVLIYCLDANLPDSAADNGSASPAGDGSTDGAGSAAAVSSVRVRHAGKVLHTYALDLSGTPDDVGRNIRALADWIARRTNPAD